VKESGAKGGNGFQIKPVVVFFWGIKRKTGRKLLGGILIQEPREGWGFKLIVGPFLNTWGIQEMVEGVEPNSYTSRLEWTIKV